MTESGKSEDSGSLSKGGTRTEDSGSLSKGGAGSEESGSSSEDGKIKLMLVIEVTN